MIEAHVAPVVVIAHRLGPEGWATRARLVDETLQSHPHLAVTLRMPGAALEELHRREPALVGRLAARAEWLAGGFSDPVLAEWPAGTRLHQLERERKAMEGAGVTPTGLWVGSSWDPDYASLARQLGMMTILVDATRFDPVPPRHGSFDRAGETVTVFPVTTGSIEPGMETDGVRVLRVEAAELSQVADSARGRTTTPSAYGAGHHPQPMVEPEPNTRDNRTDTFYRRLLLITSRERRPGTVDGLLTLQSRELSDPDLEAPPWDRLVSVNTAIEAAHHRGDGWAEVKEVDWDGDGIDEVWVETSAASMMIDPADGALDWWDDKVAGWPVTVVDPASRGSWLRTMTVEGEVGDPRPLRLLEHSDLRSDVGLRLVDEAGNLLYLRLSRSSLVLEVSVARGESLRRIGPELPLGLEGARVRVDGSEWIPITQPRALSGHRFRMVGEGRTFLISAPRPIELFVHPQPGRGLVVWPHWLTTGGSYTLTFTLGSTEAPAG